MSSFSPSPLGRAANRDGDARLAIVVAARVQPEAVVRAVLDLGLVVPACVDPPPLLVVTVPEATRSYLQMALIDETLAGAGWCGPPVVEPVDPATAQRGLSCVSAAQTSFGWALGPLADPARRAKAARLPTSAVHGLSPGGRSSVWTSQTARPGSAVAACGTTPSGPAMNW